MKQMRRDGYSLSEIARATDRRRAQVCVIVGRQSKQTREMRELRKCGFQAMDIAEVLGVSKGLVSMRTADLGLRHRNRKRDGHSK